MKPLMLIIALLVNGIVLSQSSKPVNAKLQKVTVYLSGAHLYYSESVNLVAGNNEIVFENISPLISEASLQASCKGGVVMEVKHRLKYKESIAVTRKYDKEIENVTDSIEDLDYDLKDIANKESVLATEKTMLLNNRIIKGQPLRDSLALLRDGMSFLKEKLNGIYEQELKLERSKNKITKKRTKLDARYNELMLLQSGQSVDYSKSRPIHEVVVTLFSETATPAQVNFNYLVQQANWVPVYDLQASSVTNNFQLKYFANVTQSTGLNWTNVPLTLSTSNPGENNIRPNLNPWYLGYVLYQKNKNASNAGAPMHSEVLTVKRIEKKENIKDMEDDKSITEYIEVTENLIRTEYEIKLSYTINADGLGHKVLINQKDIPMILQFSTVPKICTDAFLMARITGWEDMNIIPGNARLYFDGSYVGEMYLSALSTDDTLSVNLGRDKSIAITRKKIKEKSKVKFLGDEKIETRSIELVVRNSKNLPIEIVVEDQIPVVKGTEDIVVKLIDGDGAELDEPSGSLKWKLKLNAKDSKKMVFTYEIRYPKSKPVAGL